MFTWFCDHVAHGVHIGNCMDRFFVFSCCKISNARRIGKPNGNIKPPSKPFTSKSNANKTTETAKENFPEVEPLDEIINASSIVPLKRKPVVLGIRIINTSNNDDFLTYPQSNQLKVPKTEQIMKKHMTLIQSYYKQLYRFQFNSSKNEGDNKSYDNTETHIQKIPLENSELGPVFYHQYNRNTRQYEINNHEQQSPKQRFNTDREQLELEKITSCLKNAIKNNYKNNTIAKPVTSLMPHKLNDDSSSPSSTISSSYYINNKSESLYKVNISATSYSLSNEDTTLPKSLVSTSNLSLNSSKYLDLHFSVSSSTPAVFKPVSSPSETALLQDEVITPSAVYVLKDSGAQSLDIFPSNSISATESPYEVNISNTLSSIKGITHSDTDRKKSELEKITFWLENFVKNNYKSNTNTKPVNPLMPQKFNDNNSTPSSNISPSNTIKNGSDALYKVNISHTLYTSLKDVTISYNSSESTSNFSFNFTNFLDPHFLMLSSKQTISESVSNPSEIALLQDEVITPSTTYALKDSGAPSLDIFPSISNATESLYEVNISDTLHYLRKETTSYESSKSTSALEFNFTKYFDPHFSVSSSKPSISEAVNSSSEAKSLPVEVISPSTVYVFKDSCAPSFSFTKYSESPFLVSSWKLAIFEPVSSLSETTPQPEEIISPFLKYILKDISALSANISPYISINNGADLSLEDSISDTLYFLKNETKSYESSVSTSNLSLNFTKCLDPHFSSSSKPVSSLIETATLPNIVITPLLIDVLKYSRAPSLSSSVSHYNSTGSDSPYNARTI